MLAKSALGRIGSFYGGGALRKPRRIVGVCRGFLCLILSFIPFPLFLLISFDLVPAISPTLLN